MVRTCYAGVSKEANLVLETNHSTKHISSINSLTATFFLLFNQFCCRRHPVWHILRSEVELVGWVALFVICLEVDRHLMQVEAVVVAVAMDDLRVGQLVVVAGRKCHAAACGREEVSLVHLAVLVEVVGHHALHSVLVVAVVEPRRYVVVVV